MERAKQSVNKSLEDFADKDVLKVSSSLKDNKYVTPKVLYLLLIVSLVSFVLMVIFYFPRLFGGELSDADLIKTINVNMKIMPSYNLFRNMAEMEFIDDTDLSSSEFEGAIDQINEWSGYIDTYKIDLGDSFFFNNTTPNYFPTLYFDEDHVPMGDSQSYCIYLKFIEKENRRYKDSYRNFTNFPNCTNALNPKFRWQENDPRTGQDFMIWNQTIIDAKTKEDCDEQDGIYMVTEYQGPQCYIYDVLSQICLAVMQNDDPDTPDVEWKYNGGCFKEHKAAMFVRAKPNTTYTFQNVMVIVRESEIPRASWLFYFFMFLGFFTLFLFIGIVVAGKKGMLPK